MKKNFKIAQVVCHLPPDPGGIGMVAHSYADQMTERGYDVTVFVPRSKKNVAGDKSYKVVSLIPWLKAGLGAFMPQLLRQLWRFQIVHWHYPMLGSTLVACLLKQLKKEKVKLVVTYHMDVNLSGWKKIYEMIFQKLTLPCLLKHADKIIVSSADYIENSQIQHYYFSNIKKFEEIPFGVPRFYHPMEREAALMEKYGFTSDDKIAVFVGGLDSAHYFKGINYLIKAISLIDNPKVKALIVGEGNLRSNYEKLTEELHLTDRIKFTGYIDKQLIAQYYNLGDILVLPSINSSEAFGIVLIEAMACGKPVIASNLKGVRAVVDPGVNGLLVEPKNSRDLAEKIKYLVDNPEVMKKFGADGLETVERKYRWSVITDKLEKLYLDLFEKNENLPR